MRSLRPAHLLPSCQSRSMKCKCADSECSPSYAARRPDPDKAAEAASSSRAGGRDSRL